MAIRITPQIGDPCLKALNEAITDFNSPRLIKLVTDLKDTMVHIGLIGIAAPQIGENYQVFLTKPRKTAYRDLNPDKLRVYINPAISFFSKETSVIYEGCGSLDVNLFGPVLRPREIVVAAFDAAGKQFRLRCNGILARVIQHEYDHLQGIEFIQKVSDYSKILSVKYYQEMMQHPSPEQDAAARITKLVFKYL